MKVKELTKEHEGRRIQVTAVADSAIEHQDQVPKDSDRLKGATGTITQVVVGHGDGSEAAIIACQQAWVDWENQSNEGQSREGPGSLALASEDEIEFIPRPLADWEVANGQTLLRAAQGDDVVLLRSREVATGKEVALVCALTIVPGSAGAGIVPLAVLIDGNPYELYESPEARGLEQEPRVALPPGVHR